MVDAYIGMSLTTRRCSYFGSGACIREKCSSFGFNPETGELDLGGHGYGVWGMGMGMGIKAVVR